MPVALLTVSRLRRHYGAIVLALGVALFVGLFLAGLITRLPMNDFVVAILAPAAPFLTWTIREYYRQRDTADQLDEVRKAEVALWDQARAGLCVVDDCLSRSREFQMRADLEDQMNAGAAERMRELGLDPGVPEREPEPTA